VDSDRFLPIEVPWVSHPRTAVFGAAEELQFHLARLCEAPLGWLGWLGWQKVTCLADFWGSKPKDLREN